MTLKTAQAHNAQLTGYAETLQESKLPFGKPTQKRTPRKRKVLTAYRAGIKDCDVLWRFIIKARADWKCELRGKDGIKCSDVIQAAHLITRGVKKIRHDLRNGRSLCSGHHVYFTMNEHQWRDVCDKYWKQDYDELNLYRRTPSKPDLELVFQVLRIEAKQYEIPDGYRDKRLKVLLQ